MAREAKSSIFYVEMGGTKIAWRAPKDAYKGIDSELGVKVAKDTDNGLHLGSRTKPLRVRISLANGKSILRFADPGKAEDLVVKGSLNRKKYDGQEINSVSFVQG